MNLASTPLTYRPLAAMPIGTLLKTIVEWDAPGLVPTHHIEDAVFIQREHMVIAAFKRDLILEGPLARHISPAGCIALRSGRLSDYQGPLGTALATFAASCLVNPDYDFAPHLAEAAQRQEQGLVPVEVPSIGVIL